MGNSSAKRERRLRLALRRLLTVGALLLVLVAVVSAASRALLPWVERYQPDFEAMVSEQLDVPVRFGKLDLRWQGYQPQVILQDVRVDAGPRADSLALGLAWWRSLLERRLVADKITLDAPRFTLIRGADSWSVADLSLEPRPGVTGQRVSWAQVEDQLARLGHVSVRNAVVEFRDPAGRRDRLTFSLAAELDRSQWRASGTARLSGISEEAMHFAGSGNFGEQSDVSLFVRVDDWRLPEVQRTLGRYGGPTVQRSLGGCPGDNDPIRCEVGMPRVDSGTLNGRLWLDWRDSRLQGITLQADIQDLAVTREAFLGGKSQQAALSEVSTTMAWSRVADGWDLDAEAVRIRPVEGAMLPTEFVRLKNRGQELRFATNHADLGHLAVWLAAAPLPADFLDLLDQNVPRGQARDVRLRFEGGRLVEGFLNLRDFGNTTGVPLRPVIGTRSGRGGADLTLYRQPGGWLAQVDQRDLILAVPGMFREPVPIDHIQGRLYWFDRQGLALYSPDLVLNSGSLDLAGRFYYREAIDDRPGYLGIDTGFDLDDTREAPTYLPRHVIGSETLAWLDRALEGEGAQGRVDDGHFIFHGDPARAPFTSGGGYFSVVFDFDDVTLPYRPGWPPLTDSGGQMAFVNKQYHVDIERGQLGELAVGDSRVSIFDLDAPKLQVAVDREESLEALISTLEQTPLVGASSFDWLSVEGNGRFSLDLLIGLSDGSPPPSTTGQYTFAGNRLSTTDGRLELNDVTGHLHFTDTRFSADDLSGVFLGRPFRAQVAPRDGVQGTRIRAQTSVSPAVVRSSLGESGETPLAAAVFGSIDGITDVGVRVDVPHGEGAVGVRVESALTGWQSRLPAPLNKPSSISWPLRLDLSIARGRVDAVSARIEGTETWRAELDFADDGALSSSRVGNRDLGTVGEGRADASHRVGISLASLSVGPWIDWWSSVEWPSGGTSGGTGGGPADIWLDARLGQLRLGDWWLEDLSLGLSPRSDGWWLGVSGEENRGEVRLAGQGAASPGRLEGSFEQLKLHRETDKLPTPPTPSAAWPLASLPDAELAIRDLSVDDMMLGRLEISARQGSGDYRIDRIDWQPVPALSVSGSGRVEDNVGTGPDGQQTRLSLMLQGDEFGQALAAIHGDSPIQGGTVEEGSLSISWPGSPTSFAVSRAAGHGRFTLNEGQLKGIDPGAGRLVGLMSLGALTDRLRLDFRDVTREGLYFESLEGQWRLDRGTLTVDKLEMTNPSIRSLIDGNVNLVDQQLDLTARVYADFGMLLPLIGTVAGGPLVGGAVLALQETFRQLDEAPEPSMTYHIGGSFDQPQVTRGGIPALPEVTGGESDAQ
ncbi:TIGR02099 family protein [Guyparkeria hydrothermalis]|uniref:YhdP family protein n=1 Tax=Guyparkeria hydrothermalis TaxID=923 RepID=UPI002021FFF6|nr:YhdP family protein [Guyparkeria hydrothermalis]MCL7744233.1 TIGR02099 family protein [Guyparkeria hydrothermalis]